MHRFFVEKAAVGAAHIEITDKENVGHIGRVLRLRTGDRILVCDGEGWEYTCVLEEIGKQSVSARIEDKQKNATEPSVEITLYQGEAAAKQSGRGIIPPVEEAEDFGDMLEELRSYPLVLFPYENEDGATMKDALQASHSQLAAGSSDSAGQQDRPRIAVVIGPEGGFADEEADALKALDNCHCVSLGKRILRTETAGLAAVSSFMCLYGEME